MRSVSYLVIYRDDLILATRSYARAHEMKEDIPSARIKVVLEDVFEPLHEVHTGKYKAV